MKATPTDTGSAEKDRPHMTPEWDLMSERIAGVRVREVKHVVTANGHTTELFRKDWGVVESEVVHMIHVTLHPGATSAWHMHKLKTDHLFVVGGAVKAVLYDDREDSPTRGQVDVFHLSAIRPMLVVIPPEVWHGLQVPQSGPCSFVNFFDHAYDYDNPDDWRLPADTPEIPYSF
ncbi:MAG TPA: dTDP-4-dehydrorhamnose 3,5-epimerase family protein [Solirubrobacteraceae bacterium]